MFLFQPLSTKSTPIAIVHVFVYTLHLMTTVRNCANDILASLDFNTSTKQASRFYYYSWEEGPPPQQKRTSKSNKLKFMSRVAQKNRETATRTETIDLKALVRIHVEARFFPSNRTKPFQNDLV